MEQLIVPSIISGNIVNISIRIRKGKSFFAIENYLYEKKSRSFEQVMEFFELIMIDIEIND